MATRQEAQGPATAGEACVACGGPIDPGDEHFPHEADCENSGAPDWSRPASWCTCDQPAHPACCPDPFCP